MTDKSRWIHLPKEIGKIGQHWKTEFFGIRPSYNYKDYANDILTALGLEQITIHRDGYFDTYNVPEQWNIERYDDSGFKLTIRKKEGLIALENAAGGNELIDIKVPTDKKYEELIKLACKPGEILVPRYFDTYWTKEGIIVGKKYVYGSSLYDSSLPFENIPIDERKKLGEKVLSDFFRVKLPEGSEISFESMTIDNHRRSDTLVAKTERDDKPYMLRCQFWPGWYFGGKKRNSRMRIV